MKKCKRECDVYQSHELVREFVKYCNHCERGCPMGCIRRKDDVPSLLMDDSWKYGNILHCFAQFALSKHVEGKDTTNDV